MAIIGTPWTKSAAAHLSVLIGRRAEAARLRELACFDRGLRLAASSYVASRHYADLTSEAARGLRRLEQDAVALALAIFAYDTKHTVADLLALHETGQEAEALKEWVALRGRVFMNWAFEKVALPHPRPNLLEVAAPLGLGLGMELKALLDEIPFPVSQGSSWLQFYGLRLDRFNDYITSRSR